MPREFLGCETDPAGVPLDGVCRQAYNGTVMRRLSFFIPEHLDEGLKALKVEHGTPEAETIRRALAVYLKEKGVLKQESKPAR